jgi:hypothetical protein
MICHTAKWRIRPVHMACRLVLNFLGCQLPENINANWYLAELTQSQMNNEPHHRP